MAGRLVVGVLCVLAGSAILTPAASATTYSNPTPIYAPANSTAMPYPSTISVTGLIGSTLGVKAGLTIGLARWADLDALLVGPGGTTVLMSDVCGNNLVMNIRLGFDDLAPWRLPVGDCVSFFTPGGNYQPTNFDSNDTFPTVAPPYPLGFASFRGLSPNGLWRLYVVNDGTTGDDVRIDEWNLEIATTGPKRRKRCKKLKHGLTKAAKRRRCKKKWR